MMKVIGSLLGVINYFGVKEQKSVWDGFKRA